MSEAKKEFNLVIAGVGGQGLITLGRILSRAAFLQGLDVKMSELHGLSQRGGSVAVNVRFGKKVFSPLVTAQQADLILVLERNESLRDCSFANPERTIFFINDNSLFSPSFAGKRLESFAEIKKLLEEFSKKIYSIKATEKMQLDLGSPVLAGIYMVAAAVFNNLIPLKEKYVLRAMKDLLPGKFDKNIKAFKLGKKVKL